MTRPRRPDQPPPHVRIAPFLRTGAGMAVAARVVITNRADAHQAMLVTAMGVDAAWLPKPTRTLGVAPGATVEVDVVVVPAPGTLPALYPFVVTVQALDPATDAVSARPSVVESELIVDAPGNVGVAIKSADTTTVFRRRVTVVVTNDSVSQADVDLEIRHPDSITVDVEAERLTVGPREERRLRGTIRARPARMFGHPERHTYTITARSAGSPRHVEGAVTTRAVIGLQPARFAIIAAFIAAWVVLAITFVPKLADNVRHKALSEVSKIPVPSQSIPGGSNGSGGSGGPNGSGGSGGSNGNGGAAQGLSAPKDVRLSGTVGGVKPQGVTVAMQSTTLGDAQTQHAQGVGISTDSLNAVGMIPSDALTVETTGTLARHRKMTTASDGAWSFPQVPAPGLYLVTFTKPGFQTQRYVVDSATLAAQQPLKISMVPGEGTLSGTVLGPNGKGVGQAQVTISDGTNTFTTTTDTKGAVGSWMVHGLSTPDTYLVSAAKDGLGLESQLVTFDGGGSASVQLELKAGVATLMGTVGGHDSFGNPIGIGDAHVTATSGELTRTATTITGTRAGLFRLPDLPTPGTYTVTVSAPGFQPQTIEVSLRKGQSARTINPQLTSTGAVVTGTVKGDDLNTDGTPKSGTPVPKVGAGLTLASPTNTYKITSVSGGGFRFSGVAPGTYVLSAEYAGLQTQYETVKAVAGGQATAKFTLHAQPATYTNASITGFVGSAVSPSGSLCSTSSTVHTCPVTLTFTLRDSANHLMSITPKTLDIVAPHGPSRYTLTADTSAAHFTPLTPGEYRLTVAASKDYLAASINVQVPLDGPGNAPQLNLFPSDTISGQLTGNSSLGVNPYDSSIKYVNCVWAIPVDASTPTLPTTCPADNDQPDQSACTDQGQAAPAHARLINDPGNPADDGTYTIGGLCDGTYNMAVVLANPFFVKPLPDSSLTVTHGDTQRFAPHVQRLGRAVLNLSAFNGATGNVAPIANGTSVTATCDAPVPAPPGNLTSGGTLGNQVIIWGLPADQTPVSCQATIDDSGSPDNGKSGSIGGIVGVLDQDSSADLTLTKATSPMFGRVVSTWTDTANQAVSGASVTVNGTVGYTGSTSIPGSAGVTTNANGCFAIVPKDFVIGTDDLGAPSACGSMTAANIAKADAGADSFVTAAVTTSITASGYETISNQAMTLGQASGSPPTATATVVSLRPVADTFSGRVAFDPTSVPIVIAANAVVHVDASKAAGAGSIRAYVDTTGAMHWTDSNLGGATDRIWPGTYTITVSLPGYTALDSSYTVTCGLNTSGSATCSPVSKNGTDSAPVTLQALGALNGTVTGYLTQSDSVADTDLPSTPNQPIAGAKLILTKCGDATCTDANLITSTQLTVFADNGGVFHFTDPSGLGELSFGNWKLVVDAPGWRPNAGSSTTSPQVITIGSSNLNPSANVNMLVDRATLNVTLTTGGTTYTNGCDTVSPGTTAGCPTVQLVPVSTFTFVDPDSGFDPDGTGNYRFSKVLPQGNYWVFVNDPTETIMSTQLLVFVPLPSSDGAGQAVQIPITQTHNSVSGSVSGANQAGTGSTPLNNVPVSLYKGAITDTTGLSVALGTDGQPLTTTTQSNGSFAFTTVPNGTFTALYNDPNDSHFDDTYQSPLSSDTVVVFGGQSASFAAATIPRSTANVTVTLTSTNSADTEIRSAQVELDAAGAPAQHPAGAPTGTYTWTFNNVASGSWTIKVTLPDNHFGDLSLQAGTTLAMSCTTGTSTTDVSCTSGSFTVRKTDRAFGYNVREYAIGLSVIADPLDLDTSGNHPANASLTVVDSATTPNTVYSNSVGVNDAGSTPTADATIWGRTGQSYVATATSTATNWPIGTHTFSAASTTSVPLTEIGVTVTVNVKSGSPAANLSGATVSFPTSPTGVGAIADQNTNGSGNAVFHDIPFASGYKAHAEKTTGTGASQVTVQGDSASFNLGAATCTGSGASTTCSITENIVAS